MATEVIRAGGLVAFPTETVYGLGGDALNPDAVARIFEAKQRPSLDPLIIHFAEPTTLTPERSTQLRKVGAQACPAKPAERYTLRLSLRSNFPVRAS